MSITAAEILYRLSGGASNANEALSLGGVKSSTVADAAIFPPVASSDASAGLVDYRCLYVHNSDASLTLIGANLTIPTNTPSPTTAVDVGVGTSVVNGTEQSVASATTAPSGVTFGASAALGDIPAGQSRAIWIRRTINPGTAAITDGFTIRVTGDTQ